MLTRFDHAVIAVRDLDDSMAAFRRLGFDVQQGGTHPGIGTANALIRFGLDYIELLTVVDRTAALAAGRVTQVLLEFIQQREGFVGYGVTSDDLEGDVARIRRSGLAVRLMPLTRNYADGTAVRWMLALPEGMPWQRPWPFLIQCDTPDEVRVRTEPPVNHGNGANRCVEAVVAAGEAVDARRVLGKQIGLVTTEDSFRAGSFSLHPSTEVAVSGLRELRIVSSELDRARATLPSSAITRSSEDELAIDPNAAAGASIVLVRRSGFPIGTSAHGPAEGMGVGRRRTEHRRPQRPPTSFPSTGH